MCVLCCGQCPSVGPAHRWGVVPPWEWLRGKKQRVQLSVRHSGSSVQARSECQGINAWWVWLASLVLETARCFQTFGSLCRRDLYPLFLILKRIGLNILPRFMVFLAVVVSSDLPAIVLLNPSVNLALVGKCETLPHVLAELYSSELEEQ